MNGSHAIVVVVVVVDHDVLAGCSILYHYRFHDERSQNKLTPRSSHTNARVRSQYRFLRPRPRLKIKILLPFRVTDRGTTKTRKPRRVLFYNYYYTVCKQTNKQQQQQHFSTSCLVEIKTQIEISLTKQIIGKNKLQRSIDIKLC
jgi:hypothetical protein